MYQLGNIRTTILEGAYYPAIYYVVFMGIDFLENYCMACI